MTMTADRERVDNLDPAIVDALRTLADRNRNRPRPTCPRCGHRPQTTPEGWCAPCRDQRDQAGRDRRLRWYHRNADEINARKRAARRRARGDSS